jgi:capsule polysaccharide export protein KpsC/LpsZ
MLGIVKAFRANVCKLKNLLAISLKPKKSIVVADEFLPWLGLSFLSLQSILRRKGVNAIPLSSIGLTSTSGSIDLHTHEYCRNIAEYPALVESEDCSPEISQVYNELLDKWTKNLSNLVSNITSFFKEVDLCGVVIVHGFEPTNAALRASAILSSIPCLAIENTSRPDRLIWDNIASYACVDNLSRNYYFRYKNLVANSTVLNYRELFTSKYIRNKSEEHRSCRYTDHQTNELNRQDYVLFLGQVYTDAATINCLNDWSSPLELLEYVVDWCVARGVELVVKLHPKELCGRDTITDKNYEKLTYRKIADNPRLATKLDMCAYIDSENTLDTVSLIKSSAFVVTLTSQAGIEAAILGKAVVIGGRSTYSGLGFTYDAPSPWLLDAQLSKAWSNKNLDLSFEASRYAYIYFEIYCIHKSEECLADLCISSFLK